MGSTGREPSRQHIHTHLVDTLSSETQTTDPVMSVCRVNFNFIIQTTYWIVFCIFAPSVTSTIGGNCFFIARLRELLPSATFEGGDGVSPRGD